MFVTQLFLQAMKKLQIYKIIYRHVTLVESNSWLLVFLFLPFLLWRSLEVQTFSLLMSFWCCHPFSSSLPGLPSPSLFSVLLISTDSILIRNINTGPKIEPTASVFCLEYKPLASWWAFDVVVLSPLHSQDSHLHRCSMCCWLAQIAYLALS